MRKRPPAALGEQGESDRRKGRQGKGRVWPQHKLDAVLEYLRGKKTVVELCQQYAISQSTFFAWQEQFLKGATDYLAHGGMSAREKRAREEVRQLEKALARETLDKRIVTEALELIQDPRWCGRPGRSG